MAVTWVKTQVLNSVATMWLVGLTYVCQSLPRQSANHLTMGFNPWKKDVDVT
jgi:hypothetical protein